VIRRLAAVLALAFVLCVFASLVPLHAAGDNPFTFSEFFKPGTVFQDRNGDGVVDFVDARVVVAPQPTAGELAAAADVAARLGYETTAMNLPVVRLRPDATDSSTPIFIGAKSLAGTGVAPGDIIAIGGSGLKAGDGVVSLFAVGGKPAVAILGGDDDGLTAAAVMLGGHLPYVWDQKSPTTDKIADDVKEFLNGKNIAAVSAAVQTIAVHHGVEGADRVTVDVPLATGADLIKAQVALNQFKATASRDPKRPLSYAMVRTLRMRLHSPGAGVFAVDLPRAAATVTDAAQPRSTRTKARSAIPTTT
jgi:hypothetical protein